MLPAVAVITAVLKAYIIWPMRVMPITSILFMVRLFNKHKPFAITGEIESQQFVRFTFVRLIS